ncbi:lysophospholipid acyltransferase family protein [Lentisphaerota bacterium ZTH]|nr:lysophospholipid acyltransferase family protein [Lentisphaerota bacterium]WET05675.1 lysophospholipid acyltransferase family protein [Lentisphaerota bacterium ZTH]
MSKLKKKFRNIKKLPDWIYVLPALFLKLIRKAFYRLEIIDPDDLTNKARSCITVTWHNRLMFFPAAFPAVARKRTKAVVSASRDGQYITDLIAQFGIGSVRGSSSRKGANAQRAALKGLKDGYHVAFTPDGPRGPKYKMAKGPVHLASITGRPIVPLSINASRYWQIRSWDNFQIPKPFAKLTLILGQPIEIPPDLSDKELEKWRQLVEDKLMEITAD